MTVTEVNMVHTISVCCRETRLTRSDSHALFLKYVLRDLVGISEVDADILGWC